MRPILFGEAPRGAAVRRLELRGLFLVHTATCAVPSCPSLLPEGGDRLSIVEPVLPRGAKLGAFAVVGDQRISQLVVVIRELARRPSLRPVSSPSESTS